MNKELCFAFEDKKLYMEQILVEYDNVPIFYICSGEAEYYLVLRRNLEEETYMVVKPMLKQISDMLQGKLTMRDIIIKQSMYWDIVAGENVEDDIVVSRDIVQLPLQDLPYEDSFFKIATEEQASFARNVEQQLFKNIQWEELMELSPREIQEAFQQESSNLKDVLPTYFQISGCEWILRASLQPEIKEGSYFVLNCNDIMHKLNVSMSEQEVLNVEISLNTEKIVNIVNAA